MTPRQLYELWERQGWASQAIDLERDKEQWAALSDEDNRRRGREVGADGYVAKPFAPFQLLARIREELGEL